MKRVIGNLFLLPVLIAALGSLLTGRVTAQTYNNVHQFNYPNDGAKPQAGLILLGNTLYGTTSGANGAWGYGTVFKVNTDGSNPTNFYTFTSPSYPNYPHTNSDGAFPAAGLVLSGNTVYGTASGGGIAGNGTVFKVNIDGSGFTNMHNFTVVGFNGSNNDGSIPLAGLILSGNTLYGTTSQGGSQGDGTVFAINTDGSGFTNLYSFTNGTDGAVPVAGLVLSGSTLYGTAEDGGASGNGTLYAINTNGTGFTNIYSFTAGDLNADSNVTNSDGALPAAKLILSGGILYGTASGGGLWANGTVFAVNTDGSGFTNLYSFSDNGGGSGPNSDGADPLGGLLLLGNTLYGMANQGGASANGTVFAINTDGTGFTNLFDFNLSVNDIGAYPYGELVSSGSNLFGTTFSGGYQYGVVFSLSETLPPAPQLAITRLGTNVILTWPTNAGVFNLESATNLAPPVSWIPVSGQSSVTNPIAGKQMFYRLSQ